MNGLEKGTLDVLRRSAREIVRIAKARKVTLKSPKRDSSELDALEKFLSLFGSPPSDEKWSFAARIAEHLGQSLTAEQALNEFHCGEFIRLNEANFFENAPSLKQIELAKCLASLKAIPLPRKSQIHLSDWEAFMGETLTSQDNNLIKDYLMDFSIPTSKVDFSSFGSRFEYLRKATEAYTSENSKLIAKCIRIREILKSGSDIYSVADALTVGDDLVIKFINEVEAEGYEVAY